MPLNNLVRRFPSIVSTITYVLIFIAACVHCQQERYQGASLVPDNKLFPVVEGDNLFLPLSLSLPSPVTTSTSIHITVFRVENRGGNSERQYVVIRSLGGAVEVVGKHKLNIYQTEDSEFVSVAFVIENCQLSDNSAYKFEVLVLDTTLNQIVADLQTLNFVSVTGNDAGRFTTSPTAPPPPTAPSTLPPTVNLGDDTSTQSTKGGHNDGTHQSSSVQILAVCLLFSAVRLLG
ncbi:uncharacterized protein LOC144452871 isoform X2 [Glandiceps talaboti]